MPATAQAEPDPPVAADGLSPREMRALQLTLQDLDQLDQLDDLVPAFAARGILALQYLGEKAEELFDHYFWHDSGGLS